MVKRKKKLGAPRDPVTGFKRNPADVASGFDAGKATFDVAGQRTASKAEIATFQKTGKTVQEQRAEKIALEKEKIAEVPKDPDTARDGDVPVTPLTSNVFDEIQQQSLAPVEGQPEQDVFVGQNVVEGDGSFRVEDPSGAIFDESGEVTNRLSVAEAVQIGAAANPTLRFGSLAVVGTNKGVKEIVRATKNGDKLIKSGGLSNKEVGKSAYGKFLKEKGIKMNGNDAGMNPNNAKKTISWVGNLVSDSKYQKALTWVVGTTILNGFLEEEADQNIGFAIREAQEEGQYGLAEELIEYRKELTDRDMWDIVELTIPLKGVKTYMEAAAKNVKVQEEKNRRLREGRLTPREQEQQDRDLRFEQIRQEQRERDAKFDRLRKEKEAKKK